MHRRIKSRFIPSTFGGPELETREVLSSAGVAAHVASIQAASDNASNRGRPPIDTSLPFVFAQPGGPSQNALNFTSHTYYQIINGGGGVDGLKQIFNRFNRTNDLDRLSNDLTRLAQRVPFGVANLLPTWQDIIAGTPTPMATGIRAANHGNNQAYGHLIQQLRQATADYVNGGVGTDWNILLSQDRHSTDFDLMYNGRVGRSNHGR